MVATFGVVFPVKGTCYLCGYGLAGIYATHEVSQQYCVYLVLTSSGTGTTIKYLLYTNYNFVLNNTEETFKVSGNNHVVNCYYFSSNEITHLSSF